MRIEEAINGEASPGVPYVSLGRSNSEVMQNHQGLVWDLVRCRLEALCVVQCGHMPAEELVKQGLCDPIRVFVKNEPHSEGKLKDGRYRLIMSVSLVDQLVERVLSSEQNSREIASFDRLPVKPGMGFSKTKIDANGAYLDTFERLVSTDVSGWDWSVSGDELLFDAKRRSVAAGVPEDSPYARALRARAVCLSRSVISFSDGTMVAQRFDGIQKSGSYNTSSGNSWIRVAAAVYSGASKVCAMGDDCIDDGCDLEKMASLGHPIKDCSRVDASHPSWQEEVSLWPSEMRDDVRRVLERHSWMPYDASLVPVADFCSHWWCTRPRDRSWVIRYRGFNKSLFRLAQIKQNKREHLCEFLGLMAGSPATPHCVAALLDEGWFDDFQLL